MLMDEGSLALINFAILKLWSSNRTVASGEMKDNER